jgi:hypothetical protein
MAILVPRWLDFSCQVRLQLLLGFSQLAGMWVPSRAQRVLRDTLNPQFTCVTGASKFGTYSSTAVLEY